MMMMTVMQLLTLVIMIKAVTSSLFFGEGCFFLPLSSLSLISFSFPFLPPLFPFLSTALKWPLNPAMGFGGVLLAFLLPSWGERHLQPPDMFPGLLIHQKCAYGLAPAINAFLVYLEDLAIVFSIKATIKISD